MAEEMGERTELPTSRRLNEARGRGQVARSIDLAAAVEMIAAVLALWYLGAKFVVGLADVLRRCLANQTPGALFDPTTYGELALWALTRGALILAPFVLIMFVVIYLVQASQVGFNFTLEPLMPNLAKLNPVTGVQRLLGRRGIVRLLVTIVKFVIVATIAYLVIRARMAKLAALPLLDLAQSFNLVFHLLMQLCAYVLGAMLVIGVADFLYQRWQHTQDLRMTKQEVKDERKSMEGDLELRAKRLRIARQQLMQRIKQNVPKADVVVTNPTHFAVALKYDAATMAAPKVIAKGADLMAFRIREIAIAHGVPIVEKPPLARALYANVNVGKSIRPEYYEAVAEVLAYVYRMENRKAG